MKHKWKKKYIRPCTFCDTKNNTNMYYNIMKPSSKIDLFFRQYLIYFAFTISNFYDDVSFVKNYYYMKKGESYFGSCYVFFCLLCVSIANFHSLGCVYRVDHELWFFFKEFWVLLLLWVHGTYILKIKCIPKLNKVCCMILCSIFFLPI